MFAGGWVPASRCLLAMPFWVQYGAMGCWCWSRLSATHLHFTLLLQLMQLAPQARHNISFCRQLLLVRLGGAAKLPAQRFCSAVSFPRLRQRFLSMQKTARCIAQLMGLGLQGGQLDSHYKDVLSHSPKSINQQYEQSAVSTHVILAPLHSPYAPPPH